MCTRLVNIYMYSIVYHLFFKVIFTAIFYSLAAVYMFLSNDVQCKKHNLSFSFLKSIWYNFFMQYLVIFPTVILVLTHNSSRAVFFARWTMLSNQIKRNYKKNYAIIVYSHDNKTWYFSDCCTNGTSEQVDIISRETAAVYVFRDGRRSIARCSLSRTKYSL